ncbi:MAG: sensor histidine kinase [Anaerolineae bacterium]
MWRSLRWRLLLSTVLVVLIAIGVTALVARYRTTGEFQRYVEHRGSADFSRVAAFLARYYEVNRSWDGVQQETVKMGQISGQRLVLANADNVVVADSDETLVGRKVGDNWPPPDVRLLTPEGPVGYLYVDMASPPNEADTAFVSAVNRSVLLGALAASIAAVVVTLALSGRIVQPVVRLTAAAKSMALGDLAVRVPVTAEDEIGQLGHAFNAMASSLARQEELRRNMVSDVAHELRTPLTNLRGYLEAARDGLLPADNALVDNLYEETMLLQRLVADLQELAQADAGQLDLQRQEVSLSNVVEQAVGMLRPQADAKGLTLTTALPPGLPAVLADPERVGQIVRNLLNNAVAHTPSGGEVSVVAAAAGDMVEVSVSDTGEGIGPEDLPRVFDRFYRADKSRTRNTGGAGLGLAIVKQLVASHGGAVSVSSELGQGTTFTFSLPIIPADWVA